MIDYQKMYYELFNEITDIIEKLKQIQIIAEEKYIECEDEFCASWRLYPTIQLPTIIKLHFP